MGFLRSPDKDQQYNCEIKLYTVLSVSGTVSLLAYLSSAICQSVLITIESNAVNRRVTDGWIADLPDARAMI